MEQILYTVTETSKILKTNTSYVYRLIKLGFLPALKLGSYKIRRSTLLEFLEQNEGKDLTDLNNIASLKVDIKNNEKEGENK